MRRMRFNLIFTIVLTGYSFALSAQTDKSLFKIEDGMQISEFSSEAGDMTSVLGHAGPAVENTHTAFCLPFNDSGAIDVYSKSGRGSELAKYKWNPSEEERAEGAGIDVYDVSNTLGLGGFALWDGEKTVRLVATSGRTAKVGTTSKGCYAELTAYGVEYKGDKVDVSIRIDVQSRSREAVVTARELSGKKLMFVTGINYFDGQKISEGEGYMYAWGVHPAFADRNVQIGAGLFFDRKTFSVPRKENGMMIIVSKPVSRVRTKILAVSSLEAELSSLKRFGAYMTK